jgi:hypothetical protein
MHEYELCILKKNRAPSLIFWSLYPCNAEAVRAARGLVAEYDSFEVWQGLKCVFKGLPSVHVSLRRSAIERRDN